MHDANFLRCSGSYYLVSTTDDAAKSFNDVVRIKFGDNVCSCQSS